MFAKVDDGKFHGFGSRADFLKAMQEFEAKCAARHLDDVIITGQFNFDEPYPDVDTVVNPLIAGLLQNENESFNEQFQSLKEDIGAPEELDYTETLQWVMTNVYQNQGRNDIKGRFMDLKKKKLERTGQIEAKRIEMTAKLPELRAGWEARKLKAQEHERDAAKFIEECFGPSVLQHVREHLRNRDYSGAWEAIKAKYDVTIAGGERAAIELELNTKTFNPEQDTLASFIAQIDQLFSLMDAGDVQPVEDGRKMMWLCDAIERGPKVGGKCYLQETIQMSQFAGLDYEHTCRSLLARNEVLKLKRQEERRNNQSTYIARVENKGDKGHHGGQSKPGDWAKNKVCYKCQRIGHIAKGCRNPPVQGVYSRDNEKANSALEEKGDGTNLLTMFQARAKEVKDGSGKRKVSFQKEKNHGTVVRDICLSPSMMDSKARVRDKKASDEDMSSGRKSYLRALVGGILVDDGEENRSTNKLGIEVLRLLNSSKLKKARVGLDNDIDKEESDDSIHTKFLEGNECESDQFQFVTTYNRKRPTKEDISPKGIGGENGNINYCNLISENVRRVKEEERYDIILNPEDEEEIERICKIGKERISLDFGLNVSNLHNVQPTDFIFDSGATKHMFGNIEAFEELNEERGMVILGDGTRIPSLGIGKIGVLEGVLYVPGITVGLISISYFDRMGYEAKFKDNSVIIYDEVGYPILYGSLLNGLYHLASNDFDEDRAYTANLSVKEGEAPKKINSSQLGGSELEILHHRWGHLSEQSIKKAVMKGTIIGSGVDYETIKNQHLRLCPDCLKGKMSQLPKRLSSTDYSNAEPFEYISTDEKGPLKIVSWPHKWKYFDLFSAKSSRWLDVRFKRTKDEFLRNLKDYVHWVEGMKFVIRQMQSDDANQYRDKKVADFMYQKNWLKATSPPGMHSDNGWIEREMRTVMEKTRTLMLVYDCPLRFWSYAVEAAVYLINRSPRSGLDWSTPFERVYGKSPDISNLVPFYAPGVTYIPKENREHNLSKKAYECRMIGYDEEGKNSYLVYVPELKKIIRSKNARFDEGVNFERNSEEADRSMMARYKTLNGDDEDLTIRDVLEFFGEVEEQNEDLEASMNVSVASGESEDESEDKKGLILPPCPKSVLEALEGEYSEMWHEAIVNEIQQLLDRETFRIVEYKKGMRVAKMRMVLQVSYDNNWKIKFKARLVLRGYSQILGVDYTFTFSPTISRDSLMIVMTLGMYRGWVMALLDVKGAFLEAWNHHEIYAEIPKDCLPTGSSRVIVQVIRSLYGEKQAAYEWYIRLVEILVEFMGFTSLEYDDCVFIKRDESGEIFIMLAVHVDDIFACASRREIIGTFKKEFAKYVTEVKEFESFEKYLGIRVKKEDQTMYLHQQDYIEDILKSFLPSDIKKVVSKRPISPRYEFRETRNGEEEVNILDIVGKLRYLADSTRPDLLVSLGKISSKGANANESYWRATMEMMRYLRDSKERKLKVGKVLEIKLFAFCDASFNDSSDGSSRLGGVFFLGYNTGSFFNFSRKDKSASYSPMQSEILSVDRAVRYVCIYRAILTELGFPQIDPSKVYTDSKSTFQLLKTFKKNKKLREVGRCLNNIRKLINEKQIQVIWIVRRFNCADGHTRLTETNEFQYSSSKILEGYTEEEILTAESTEQ